MPPKAKLTWDLLNAEQKQAVIARIQAGGKIAEPDEPSPVAGESAAAPAPATKPGKAPAKPPPKQSKSAFEYFMLDFKQSEAAKEAAANVTDKAEKSKMLRAMASSLMLLACLVSKNEGIQCA